MSPDRPTLFIGSATESHVLASKLKTLLDSHLEVTLWSQASKLGSYTYESLEAAVAHSQFAAFVFSPDDRTESRGTESLVTRANVVFELGMFMSRLGRSRTFVVKDKSTSITELSNFDGIAYAEYTAPSNRDADNPAWADALGEAASQIRWDSKTEMQNEQTKSEERTKPRNDFSLVDLMNAELLMAARRSNLPRPSEFNFGTVVVHGVYGVGEVIALGLPSESGRSVTVRFATGDAICLESSLFTTPTPAGSAPD